MLEGKEFSRSLVNEERRLLMERRCDDLLLGCAGGVGSGEREGEKGFERVSEEGEVKPLRRSLMKSLTTPREDRREEPFGPSCDADRRDSLDIRRSAMVSSWGLCSLGGEAT